MVCWVGRLIFGIQSSFHAVGYFSWCLGTLTLNLADRHLDSTFNKDAAYDLSVGTPCFMWMEQP